MSELRPMKHWKPYEIICFRDNPTGHYRKWKDCVMKVFRGYFSGQWVYAIDYVGPHESYSHSDGPFDSVRQAAAAALWMARRIEQAGGEPQP